MGDHAFQLPAYCSKMIPAIEGWLNEHGKERSYEATADFMMEMDAKIRVELNEKKRVLKEH